MTQGGDGRGSPLSEDKQIELMFLDVVAVITDRKRTIFDLSRWIVTLQGLVVGFVALRGVDIGPEFLSAPIMIGIVGLMLNASLSRELAEHRRTLARIRRLVGGHFADLHCDFIALHLDPGAGARSGYWAAIARSHKLIVMASTLVAVYSVYTILY